MSMSTVSMPWAVGPAGEEAARAAVESMASLNRAAAAIGELIAGAEGRIEVVP